MKVLLVTPKEEMPKGGIAAWTAHYLKTVSEFDIDCKIINTQKVGERNIKDEYIRTKGIFKQLKNALKEDVYDVAHLNTNIGLLGVIRDFYIAKKIKKKKLPLVVHFHCDIPYWVKNPLIKLYLKKLLKISDCNLVLCENSRKYLKGTFNQDSHKIPNFLKSTLIVNEKQINSKIKRALFIGRISIEKGAKEIFELSQEFPNIQFALAGELIGEVKDWEIPTNIQLLGILPRIEIMNQFDKSDIFIFPTHTEGFSIALAECMARGVPSITTNVGANLDMLGNKGGIICEVGDVEGMKKAVEKLQDVNIRKEISDWCIEKVKKEYTAQHVMSKIYSRYMELIKNK